GYALTNWHVTSGANGPVMKCGLPDGVLYDAVLVGLDRVGDVALIKLLGREDFPHATLGDSDTVQVGDWAYAMGNPFLLATDFQPTVTYGIVSGVHRYQYPAGTFLEYADCIQTDSSINPGNSGGPLFNAAGELIGINGRGSFEKRGRVNSGAGYAISINQIKHFMDHLKSGRIVDHATLGATVATDPDGLIVVSSILEESEAYRRGLRIDDEIVSFAGRPIGSVNQFKNVLGIYPAGWTVPLVYRRETDKHEIYVRLRHLHRKSELTGRPRRIVPEPQPKPGEPMPEDEKDQPDDRPPRPVPGHPPIAKPSVPEEHKHLFIERPGFANYYFNELHQKRLMEHVKALGDFSNAGGLWVLTGSTADGKPFEFVLNGEQAALTLGGDPFIVRDLAKDLPDEPPNTGGLLVAMHHLRLMLTQGPAAFSEFYYLGSEPLDGRGELVDVLVSTLTGVESRWYFTKDGRFVGFDTRLLPNADQCALRFEELRDFDGRRLPGRFTVNHADQPYATFVIDQAQLSPAK
ncbi:MAG: S1C family serine protease, partial [Vicinamibacterales bacterium]